MAEPTATERGNNGADIAAAARERGIEEIESAKSQLAESAERVASAVKRTADELDGGGDESLSGFGRSAATLMRQLAGGLRERDIEGFARELATLARRNPGLFLAGSVALGFGMARFFKARPPRGYARGYGLPDGAEWRDSSRGASELRGDSSPGRFDSGGRPLGERVDCGPEDELDPSAASRDDETSARTGERRDDAGDGAATDVTGGGATRGGRS